MAETFATIENSSRWGFLRTCHTLMHFLPNDLMSNAIIYLEIDVI